jgi:hypothetical protein
MKEMPTERKPWVTFGGWDGPVLDLPNASWRIRPNGGSYYTHVVGAQGSCQEIVRALADQFGIRSCDCSEDANNRNPLITVVRFRNVTRGGIGGPDHELRRREKEEA